MSQDTIEQIKDAIETLNLRHIDVRVIVKEGIVTVEEYVNYFRRD